MIAVNRIIYIQGGGKVCLKKILFHYLNLKSVSTSWPVCVERQKKLFNVTSRVIRSSIKTGVLGHVRKCAPGCVRLWAVLTSGFWMLYSDINLAPLQSNINERILDKHFDNYI